MPLSDYDRCWQGTAKRVLLAGPLLCHRPRTLKLCCTKIFGGTVGLWDGGTARPVRASFAGGDGRICFSRFSHFSLAHGCCGVIASWASACTSRPSCSRGKPLSPSQLSPTRLSGRAISSPAIFVHHCATQCSAQWLLLFAFLRGPGQSSGTPMRLRSI